MKSPVAGIAMGLITEGDKYAVLSDMARRPHGDMDFKVTGTTRVYRIQMDIKIAGVSTEIVRKPLNRQNAAGCTSSTS